MKTDRPKFWVRDKYVNRIKYRALDNREIRSPEFYAHGIETHDTWESAHAATLAAREKELHNAKLAVKRAESRLKKAKEMMPPAAPETPEGKK